MAAEVAKLRNREDFIEGEQVWVESQYFDDPKSPKESRFSATCDKVFGVIMSVSSTTCKILFDDGSLSYVNKKKLNLVGQARIINNASNEKEDIQESDSEEGSDGEAEEEEWRPREDETSSSENEESESQVSIIL